METIQNALTELISFHHVASTGSFTQAAEKLHLSKAQLSKHVSRLEMLLSTQLFHRTTRKVTLTEEGKHLFQYAGEIIKISKAATESLQEMSLKESGLIRITLPSSLGDWFAPKFIQKVQEKIPNLKIELDLSNMKRNLTEDGFDFALRAMDETDPDLIARYLGHLKDVVVATPTYMKTAKLKGTDPHELENVPVLLTSLKEAWNSWKMKNGNKDLKIDVKGNFATTNYQTNRHLVMNHLGVARIPLYLVQKDIEQKKLVHLYKDFALTTHPLYLVYPSKSYQSKKQKLVKDFILEWFKAEKEIFAKN